MTTHDHDFTAAPFLIEERPPAGRFSLRVRPDHRADMATALAMELPQKVGDRAASDGREALCLGPDEWLILVPAQGREDLIAAGADTYAATPHSLCEISDREITLHLSGPQALTALAAGCPRDLESLPIGNAARTVFDSATVILWRDSQDSFRMDIWRSFLPHVRAILHKVEAELSSGL